MSSRSSSDGGIQGSGFRPAKLKVKELSFNESILSPSRGIEGETNSIVDPKIQDDYFQNHIKKRGIMIRAEFAGKDMKDEKVLLDYRVRLSTILLDYRKLREGITASSRIDEFVLNVYESSVRCAIEASDFPSLNSSLATLVLEIYPAFSVLASSPVDIKSRYTIFSSYYLLFLLCFHNSIIQYTSTLQLLTHIDKTSSHFKLSQSTYQALSTKNYNSFERLISNPVDERSSKLLHLAVDRVREQTWLTISRAYKKYDELDWLKKILLFSLRGEEDGIEKLKEYLKSKGK